MIATTLTRAAVNSKEKYGVQNPVYKSVVNKGHCTSIQAETDTELNGDTNLCAKL